MQQVAAVGQNPVIPFLGPKASDQRQGRTTKKYVFGQNLTPSLDVQGRFADPTKSARNDDILEHTKKPKGGVKIEVTAAELQRLNDTVEVFKEFKESVAILANNRFAAFYQQLILAYATRLHFEEGETVDQGESAQTRTLKAGKDTAKLPLDASHHDALPCLYAYDLDEWNEYQESLETARPLAKPQGFVYLKGSDGYRFWNSTIPMPKKFNTSVDNTIDLHSQGLRARGLELLNRAARKEISPEDGLKEFGTKFLKIVKREKTKAECEQNEAKAYGLGMYQEEIEGIQESLEGDSHVFELFLNIQLDPNDKAEDIKRTIYQIRYRAIQQNFSKQAELAQKIEDVKQRIFGQLTSLQYGDEAFQELLTENMPKAKDRNRINIFFNTPYELRPLESRRKKIDSSKRKIQQVQVPTAPAVARRLNETGLVVIQRLGKELSREMETMRANEAAERGAVLRTLRKMRKWSQADLSSEITKHRPPVPASQSTISRCETSVRIVKDLEARWYSSALKAPLPLFIPQFFNE